MDEHLASASPARDGGPWRGIDTYSWRIRFVRDADLADVVIRSSFPIRMHAGAVPIVADAAVGPRRGAGIVADATQPLVRRGVA